MRLDVSGYYALGVPLYLVAGAVEMWRAKRRGLSVYRFADTIGNLSGGLGEVIVGLFLGPVLLSLYDAGYKHLALFHWPSEWWIGEWVAAFLLGDLCYYAYHRAGHRVALLWSIHGVHHQSEELNLSVAIRNPWFSDAYGWIFYAPLPLLGIAPEKFFLAISLISLWALTVHSRVFRRPSFWVFVTPQTHIVHHARNKRYLHKNFGAMFTMWDRAFGTHVEPVHEDPPQPGTLWRYETHDGARSQWIFFAKTHASARQAKTWREWLGIWLGRPGRIPADGVGPASGVARGDREIPFSVKAYAAAQFAWTTLMALAVLWFRERHALTTQLAIAALVLWGTSTIGGLLDGRRAQFAESVRVTLIVMLGLAFTLDPASRAAGIALVAGGLASALGLALLSREDAAVVPDTALA